MITISSAYNTQINLGLPAIPEDPAEIPATAGAHPTTSASPVQNEDTVAISDQGRELSTKKSADAKETDGAKSAGIPGTGQQKDKAKNASDLAEIQELKNRDAHVRAHEQAHLAVAGRYASGGPSYTYQTGPDGVKYAIGGEVPIDISSERTPEATIQKMETVRRAALAPSDPSSADRQIAAEATAKELQAMQELQSLQREKAGSKSTAESATSGNKTNTTSPSSSDTSSVTSGGLSAGNNRQQMIKAYQDMLALA